MLEHVSVAYTCPQQPWMLLIYSLFMNGMENLVFLRNVE